MSYEVQFYEFYLNCQKVWNVIASNSHAKYLQKVIGKSGLQIKSN